MVTSTLRIAAALLLLASAPSCAINAKADSDSAATLCVPDRGFPYLTELRQAASDWNAAAGTTLSVTTGCAGDEDIAVREIASLPEDEIAFAYVMPAGESNLIVIVPGLDSGKARAALTHEIGHQLGLHHDLQHRDAIMAEYVNSGSHITSDDVEAYFSIAGRAPRPQAPIAAP